VLHTPLCDLLGIEVPVLQAPVGPWTSPELAAAVSEAGGLGRLMVSGRPLDAVRADLDRTARLTRRPWGVNQVLRMFDEEAFALTLQAAAGPVWFALGRPGPLVARAHERGLRVIHQVHTVEQAVQAAEDGVDVVIAQGGEAGGFGGEISTLALVPQVVDAVAPLPVVAAGGIADGRGLAAALALGAQGVNVGTRFLATPEARSSEAWRRGIVAARAEDAVKAAFVNDVMPPGPDVYPTLPRVLRVPFVEEWNARRPEVAAHADALRSRLQAGLAAGEVDDLLPFAGQSAGLIDEVRPAAAVVREMVLEAERALRHASGVPAVQAS
jgi:enoyl-[acyl-carrier protein] reductase II